MNAALIYLAILQGLTEFLPISSSGHLVLGKALLGFAEHGATMEIFLHTGTLLAVIIFYYRELAMIISDLIKLRFNTEAGKMGLLIIFASIPAALVGYFGKNYFESMFSSTALVSIMLVITGLVLISTKFSRHFTHFRWTTKSALLVGIAQAFAIIPGISRSGMTIATALWLGSKGKEAARFCFILSVPAIFGATALKTLDVLKTGTILNPFYIIGIMIATIFGFIALKILMPILERKQFWIFGLYCISIGLTSYIIMGIQ